MRIALLGVSHWHAQMHADAALFSGAQLCAAWDKDPGIAASFAARHAIPAKETLAAALASDPHLCVVMGHPLDVPALARAVIEAGIPMVLEKPAACSTAQLQTIATAAKQHSAFVAVPLANRFSPALRHQAATGHRIAHAQFRIINGPPQRYRDDGVGWVLDPAIGGGGALRNLGIHGIDCALSLAKGAVKLEAAHIGKRLYADEAVEDHAIVTLSDSSGALFTIEAGYTFPSMAAGGDFQWRIASAGDYAIDNGDDAVLFTPTGRTSLAPLPAAERYRAFMADTLARLESGQPPLVGLADYVAAMDIIDQAYAGARS
ncbi:dehydrogenase [Devosia limi DSM 17137]|uniref:Dehydrogenase n=1 Tax=Devosia limi DSM 17137 TaxID=1121477 RepID=A0A0F5LVY8_9HYPH|nr:Gfo/Idh/MocA family oxidoreductase [Devosia limi]KKB86503.1 dehydrogenase [Devosia limi DSM 17137]SHE86323.1 Predicted dehydrogenase [Devosia limi DSM 17137]